jgi:hypothetical protein
MSDYIAKKIARKALTLPTMLDNASISDVVLDKISNNEASRVGVSTVIEKIISDCSLVTWQVQWIKHPCLQCVLHIENYGIIDRLELLL